MNVMPPEKPIEHLQLAIVGLGNEISCIRNMLTLGIRALWPVPRQDSGILMLVIARAY